MVTTIRVPRHQVQAHVHASLLHDQLIQVSRCTAHLEAEGWEQYEHKGDHLCQEPQLPPLAQLLFVSQLGEQLLHSRWTLSGMIQRCSCLFAALALPSAPVQTAAVGVTLALPHPQPAQRCCCWLLQGQLVAPQGCCWTRGHRCMGGLSVSKPAHPSWHETRVS
jgi:hypothetical protein